MPVYEATHNTPAGSTLPIINVVGGAGVRLRLGEIIVGCGAAVADATGVFAVRKSTSAGVGGTALTEGQRDPLSVAPTGAATGGTFTTAPTTSNPNLLRLPLHQRNTAIWQGWEGREIISVASANNGLMLQSVSHTGTPQVDATMAWEE